MIIIYILKITWNLIGQGKLFWIFVYFDDIRSDPENIVSV